MPGGQFLSLPNAISLSRLALAAGFVAQSDRWWRVGLLLAAALTDMLDGYIARRSGSVTRAGALLDPITDRFFVLAAVSSLLYDGLLTTGQYFILLARDLATAIGFLVARAVRWLRPVPFSARVLGKVVTTAQLATLAAVLVQPGWVQPLILAVGLLSAAAIVDYTLALWRGRERAAA
jgi:cardiolipin synthase (CMP-forming)